MVAVCSSALSPRKNCTNQGFRYHTAHIFNRQIYLLVICIWPENCVLFYQLCSYLFCTFSANLSWYLHLSSWFLCLYVRLVCVPLKGLFLVPFWGWTLCLSGAEFCAFLGLWRKVNKWLVGPFVPFDSRCTNRQCPAFHDISFVQSPS